MTLNMTQADAATNLLQYLAGGREALTGKVTADQAYACAQTLLEAAEKRYMMRPNIDTDQLRDVLDKFDDLRGAEPVVLAGAAEISRAVATANRSRVLEHLQTRPDGVSFADLATDIALSRGTLSRALNHLAEAGHVHKDADGRWHAAELEHAHVSHAQGYGGRVKVSASTCGPRGEKTMLEWLAKVEQRRREELLQAKAERDEARSHLADVAAVVETWADVNLDEATGDDLFQLWEAVKLALAPKGV